MKSRYFLGENFDVRALRHDLRGLLLPLSTGLNCIKTGEQTDGLMLQEEVLKKLTTIVAQLDEASAHDEPMQREQG